jgi:hypothetical protein
MVQTAANKKGDRKITISSIMEGYPNLRFSMARRVKPKLVKRIGLPTSADKGKTEAVEGSKDAPKDEVLP